mmetsp:Transcript_4864/g.6996  ORF Transcript_4864/g.6996 Transcript_4864/m.6996 type:complete len:157 (+) Transcript_4864:111-581(+)
MKKGQEISWFTRAYAKEHRQRLQGYGFTMRHVSLRRYRRSFVVQTCRLDMSSRRHCRHLYSRRYAFRYCTRMHSSWYACHGHQTNRSNTQTSSYLNQNNDQKNRDCHGYDSITVVNLRLPFPFLVMVMILPRSPPPPPPQHPKNHHCPPPRHPHPS